MNTAIQSPPPARVVANAEQMLTASRLKSERACQRLHYIEYELLMRPAVDAEEQRFGTVGHAALEAWWLTAKDGLRGDALLLAMSLATAKMQDPFERARLEAVLTGYHERWQGDLDRYEILGVEERFACELRNPLTGRASQTWCLAGKLDVRVRELASGAHVVIEHKTTSEDVSPGSEYWRRLRMDGQVSVYFEGAKSLGAPVDAVLYDVLKKPALRAYEATPEDKRKYKADGTLYANQRDRAETPSVFKDRCLAAIAEEPDKFFQRGDVVRLEQEMADALLDVWQLGQQIRENQLRAQDPKRPALPPRNPDACSRFGRTCPYFDVCTGAASLSDPRFKRVPDPHPELREEAVVAQ